MSYAVGRVNYLAVSGTGGGIFQGIQLPFEITFIPGIENPDITIIWSVYPKPAGNFITIKTGSYDFKKFFYQFYDITGDLLLDGKATGDQSRIHVVNLKAGTWSQDFYTGLQTVSVKNNTYRVRAIRAF